LNKSLLQNQAQEKVSQTLLKELHAIQAYSNHLDFEYTKLIAKNKLLFNFKINMHKLLFMCPLLKSVTNSLPALPTGRQAAGRRHPL